MPYRPARPCAHPRCPKLVTVGNRCPAHQLPPSPRPNRHERGYGNDWARLSRLVLERDSYTCQYCGAPATTADHVIPKVKGGRDELGNLVAACVSCNSRKGARLG